ncbi:hypothetical protein PM082_015402 [Marasmius tenuissimus]|nr:hypothetical protein PM082_015402 [Marasmius tenuissimus]
MGPEVGVGLLGVQIKPSTLGNHGSKGEGRAKRVLCRENWKVVGAGGRVGGAGGEDDAGPTGSDLGGFLPTREEQPPNRKISWPLSTTFHHHAHHPGSACLPDSRLSVANPLSWSTGLGAWTASTSLKASVFRFPSATRRLPFSIRCTSPDHYHCHDVYVGSQPRNHVLVFSSDAVLDANHHVCPLSLTKVPSPPSSITHFAG